MTGSWAIFDGGRNYLVLNFLLLEERIPYTTTEGERPKEDRRYALLSRANSQDVDGVSPTSGIEYISCKPCDVVNKDGRFIPMSKTVEWRRRCEAVSTHIATHVEKARLNHGVPTVERLTIVKLVDGEYLPNSFTNSVARALNMSVDRPMQLETSTRARDERCWYAVRRCHVSDLFRNANRRFMLVEVADDLSIKSGGIWSWSADTVEDGDPKKEWMRFLERHASGEKNLIENGLFTESMCRGLDEESINTVFLDSKHDLDTNLVIENVTVFQNGPTAGY